MPQTRTENWHAIDSALIHLPRCAIARHVGHAVKGRDALEVHVFPGAHEPSAAAAHVKPVAAHHPLRREHNVLACKVIRPSLHCESQYRDKPH